MNAAKFIFLNASSPDGGNGSFANPTNKDLQNTVGYTCRKDRLFHVGTYQVLEMPQTGGNGWERVEFSGTTKPVSWLEFPGQAAVIDFGWKGSGTVPLIRLINGPIYLDGFETANSHNMAFSSAPRIMASSGA